MPESDSPGLASRIGRIAALLKDERLSRGDLAALRRMNPLGPAPLTWYRFAVRALTDEWDRSLETQKNWMTIVGGMALMHPDVHDPHQPLGLVLAEKQYSDSRLERLLAAEGDLLRTLVLRMARFLAAQGARVNWVDAARLLFVHDPDVQEPIRRRIATDFFSH